MPSKFVAVTMAPCTRISTAPTVTRSFGPTLDSPVRTPFTNREVDRLAQLVGAEVIENAYFTGRVDELEKALKKKSELGKKEIVLERFEDLHKRHRDALERFAPPQAAPTPSSATTNCTACSPSTSSAASLGRDAEKNGLVPQNKTATEKKSPWDKLREYPVRVGDTLPRGGYESYVRRNESGSKYIKKLRTVTGRSGERYPRAVQDARGERYVRAVETLRDDPVLREGIPEMRHLGNGVMESDGVPGVKYEEMKKRATPGGRAQAEKAAREFISALMKKLDESGMLYSPVSGPPGWTISVGPDVLRPGSPNLLYDFDTASGMWKVYSPDPVAAVASPAVNVSSRRQ